MKIPIVFSFDENLIVPAGVCITSLLAVAKKGIFYEVYILHSPSVSDNDKGKIKQLSKNYNNCSFSFINMNDAFNGSFEIRDITKAAYYRLLIPRLISRDYDKVIYSDVDVIFKDCLSVVYSETVFQDEPIAGVKAAFVNNKEKEYLKKIDVPFDNYINSGFLIFNLKYHNINELVERFVYLAKKSYKYQDQDVINIACKGNILFLNPKFNSAQGMYRKAFLDKSILLEVFNTDEISDIINPIIIHYTGIKPWNSFCLRYDSWWECYKKSVFYNEAYYFENQNNLIQLNKISARDFGKMFIKKYLLKKEL